MRHASLHPPGKILVTGLINSKYIHIQIHKYIYVLTNLNKHYKKCSRLILRRENINLIKYMHKYIKKQK